ncbi:ComEC/Rec2 family competence protein [Nitratireductor sp. XY-223]|uniref:ComEC/Rec2 family competence protein n=1 Tax=Nitratireductor sp. XY-223 TaxID=2561926 RepID=UPI0010AA413C|nr:ComEC/Rec2 family competence protein [Nitratireductor sp. XY-223]
MNRADTVESRSRPGEGGIDQIPDAARTDSGHERKNSNAFNALAQAFREETGTGQTILWLPVAMAGGAIVWFGSAERLPLPPIAILFAVLTLWLLLKGEGRWRGPLVLAAGFLAGMLASEIETRRHQTILLDGEVTTRIEGRVVSRDVDHASRWRYTIDVERTSEPEIRRPPGRVRLVARGGQAPVEIGGTVAGLARLQPPSGPALPGGYDFSFHAYFNGLGAYGFFYGAPEAVTSAAGDDRGPLEEIRLGVSRLRAAVASRIRSVLPGDTGGFASALTVADRRGLSPDTVEALRASGLAHVLAISGLHMALVAGTFFFFVRAAFSLFPTAVQALPVKKIAAAGALVVASLYLVISGASVSTQRAWIMLAIVLVAVLVDRPALTMRNVALAAIVIIMITPSAVLGPGFQMSFAATAALIATYGLWRKYSENRPGAADYAGPGPLRTVAVFFVALGVTSIVAGLATGPYAVYSFHRVAAYGLLANLAAMPVVTFVVMPMGLVSMLALPFGLEHWPLVVMGAGLDTVMWIARSVEDLGGAVVIGRVHTGLLLVLTGGFLLFVLGRTRLRLFGLAVAVCAAVGMVTMARDDPAVVISEDGRLVALVSEDGLATNRGRPNRFVFEQWQRALARPQTISPVAAAVGNGAGDLSAILSDALRENAGTPVFACSQKEFCVGSTGSGASVAVIEDLRYLGPACDVADLVITAKRIALGRCYSGAVLVTGRMLRQSGSLEVRHRGDALEIVSAIELSDRPWTRQRFYDWRSRSYKKRKPLWMAGAGD